MKFCQKCGSQLHDESVICPKCGCSVAPAAPQTSPAAETESTGLATGAVACAILVPIVGLILGIIGVNKYRDPQLKRKCTGAIWLSLGVWIISFVLLAAVGFI